MQILSSTESTQCVSSDLNWAHFLTLQHLHFPTHYPSAGYQTLLYCLWNISAHVLTSPLDTRTHYSRHTECLSRHTGCLSRHIECLSRHTECLSRHIECLSRHTECLSPYWMSQSPYRMSVAILNVSVAILNVCRHIECLSRHTECLSPYWMSQSPYWMSVAILNVSVAIPNVCRHTECLSRHIECLSPYWMSQSPYRMSQSPYWMSQSPYRMSVAILNVSVAIPNVCRHTECLSRHIECLSEHRTTVHSKKEVLGSQYTTWINTHTQVQWFGRCQYVLHFTLAMRYQVGIFPEDWRLGSYSGDKAGPAEINYRSSHIYHASRRLDRNTGPLAWETSSVVVELGTRKANRIVPRVGLLQVQP
jgi:hypothetical protein